MAYSPSPLVTKLTNFVVYQLFPDGSIQPAYGSAAAAQTEANILTMDVACAALGIGWRTEGVNWTLTAATAYTANIDFTGGGVITLGANDLTLSGVLTIPMRQVFNENSTGRVKGSFKTPCSYPNWWWDGVSDATQAFQSAMDYSLRSATPLVAFGRFTCSGTITVDYQAAGGSMVNTGVPLMIDMWNCTIDQAANSNYLFRSQISGENAGRPQINFKMPYVKANNNTGGLLYNDSWGGNTFWMNTFTGYASGAVVFNLVNTGTGYQENNHFYGGRWIGGVAGVTACKMSTTGSSSSFARTVFRDLFLAGSFDTVFDIQAAVYNSTFDGIRGNPSSSTIFKLASGYSFVDTNIQNIQLEQIPSGGVFMDVTACNTGTKLPRLDMTNYFYDGSGTNFKVGSSGLSPFFFGGVGVYDPDGIVTASLHGPVATDFSAMGYAINSIYIQRTGSTLYIEGEIKADATAAGGSGNVCIVLNDIIIGASAPALQKVDLQGTGVSANNPSVGLATNGSAGIGGVGNLIIYPYYKTDSCNSDLTHQACSDVVTGKNALTMYYTATLKI